MDWWPSSSRYVPRPICLSGRQGGFSCIVFSLHPIRVSSSIGNLFLQVLSWLGLELVDSFFEFLYDNLPVSNRTKVTFEVQSIMTLGLLQVFPSLEVHLDDQGPMKCFVLHVDCSFKKNLDNWQPSKKVSVGSWLEFYV